jgi:hypothetical protein
MYSLQVKSPWGSVKQNRDLVEISNFTKKLLDKGIAFSIESIACKGAMSNRHLQIILGFYSLSDLNIATEVLVKTPRLEPDP